MLAIIAVTLISASGYYVYHSQKMVATQPTTQATKKPAVTKPAIEKTGTATPVADSNAGYLVIKEWGIKIKLGTADPTLVTYALSTEERDDFGYHSYGDAGLSLKPSVTSVESCRSLGIGIYRYAAAIDPKTKVGNYSYGIHGGPGSCGNDAADAIRMNYLGDNPSSWVYSAIE